MNKYEVGVLGNARPCPMAARQVARDNPVWVQAVADMVAGGEKISAAAADLPQNFTAAGGEKMSAAPASERENVTALPESELFAYGIGQSWMFRFQTRRSAARFKSAAYKYIQYTVRRCRMHNHTQYYSVEMLDTECDSVNTAELSANRLHYLINFYLDHAVTEGERQAIPLPDYIVRDWYEKQRESRAAEAQRAAQLLAAHKAYAEKEKRLKKAESEAGAAEAFGQTARAAALEQETRELRAALARLRAELGVTDDVLHPVPRCTMCGDHGILSNGRLGPCVKGNDAAIRRYWRRERGEENA